MTRLYCVSKDNYNFIFNEDLPCNIVLEVHEYILNMISL